MNSIFSIWKNDKTVYQNGEPYTQAKANLNFGYTSHHKKVKKSNRLDL